MKKLLLGALLLIAVTTSAQTAEEIVAKVFTINQMSGSEAISKLTIRDAKGHERIRKTSMATILTDDGKTEKKIIRFLEPADVKGTGMLTFDYTDKDDDMWIYMPALRKTRRIVSSEKGKSFMGSEFSNADMVMPTLADFTYTMVQESMDVDGVPCWQIEILAKDEDIADEYDYSKRIACIGKADFVIHKAQVFDYDDELMKTMTVTKIEMIDTAHKKYQVMHMEVMSENGRSSTLHIEKIIYSPNVKADYFTVSFLEK